MPYKRSQCRAFGVKSNRGKRVPADWKQHCEKAGKKKVIRKKTRRHG